MNQFHSGRKRMNRQIFSPLILGCMAMWITGMSLSADCFDADQTHSKSFRGLHLFSHEVGATQSGGSDSVYWAMADRTDQAELKVPVRGLAGNPCEPASLGVQGWATGRSAEGSVSGYDRQIIIERVELAGGDSLSECKSTQADGDRGQSAPSGSLALEGHDWELVEADGTPVAPPVGAKRPFLKFDPKEKRAAGFAGCNNFFGDYTLEGATLRIGPLASTRRACPDLEMSLEKAFLAVLEKTRSWRIDGDTLLLLDDSGVIARFAPLQADESAADLESMTFLPTSFPSGKVKLSRGEYRRPAAPGSAEETVVKLTDRRVFGEVNGREIGAAVLYTRTGGTGTFYDLVLVVRKAEGWVNTDSVSLGDRVKVQDVTLENGRLVVSMTAHGPKDPMCCPTDKVVKRFVVRNDLLVPVPGEAGEVPSSALVGPVWQWIQTLYNDGKKFAPSQPKNYTVQFRKDGNVAVKADCNLKGGAYSAENSRISIEITHSTMAACEEGSLEDQFTRDLTAGAIWFLKDGDLYIDLKYDSGTMKLSRLK